MVAIISICIAGLHHLIQRETYGEVLEGYLRKEINGGAKIVLIYDLAEGKTVYKSSSFLEHYGRLHSKQPNSPSEDEGARQMYFTVKGLANS